MTEKYTLKYTNHFTHPLNPFKRDSENLTIIGNCRITNYVPTESNGQKRGEISIFMYNGNTIIREGEGSSFSKNLPEADFSKKNFSLLTEIAKLDGNSNNLTYKDIKNIKKLDMTDLSINSIDTSENCDIATITWMNGDILRVEIEKPLKYIENLNIKYEPYIEKLSKETGFSSNFIKHILSTESFIPKARDIGDKTITIGFGHTINAPHNNDFEKGDEIDLETAFDWFKQDLLDYKDAAIDSYNKCKNNYPEYQNLPEYDELPNSLKEAIVDIAYNRGPNKLKDIEAYKSLFANLAEGKDNYCYAAVRTRQEFKINGKFTPGLRKRNVYRFLLAIQDLTPEEKIKAMNKFENSGQYFTNTIDSLKKRGLYKEAKLLQQDWAYTMQRAKSALDITR